MRSSPEAFLHAAMSSPDVGSDRSDLPTTLVKALQGFIDKDCFIGVMRLTASS
jgi:hypothetical protein